MVHDYTSRSLLGAPWGATDSSLPAESAFTVIADSTGIPALLHGDVAVFIENASIVVTDEGTLSAMWRITPPPTFPGTWNLTQLPPSQGFDGMVMRSISQASGLDGIELHGPGSCQIKTESDVLVHTGTASSGWSSTGSISALDNRAGQLLVATQVSDGASIGKFRPMLRRGISVGAAGGTLGKGLVRDNHLVPDGFAALGVPFSAVATSGTVRVALAMGLYTSSESNLAASGNSTALRWSSVRTLATDVGEIQHFIGIDVTVPDNESLHGLRPVFQWWVRFPDGSLAHSDVFGTGIIGDGTGGSPPSSVQVDLFGLSCSLSASPDPLVATANYVQIAAVVQEMLSN